MIHLFGSMHCPDEMGTGGRVGDVQKYVPNALAQCMILLWRHDALRLSPLEIHVNPLLGGKDLGPRPINARIHPLADGPEPESREGLEEGQLETLG
jgi:hypothetical protein